MTPVPDLHVFLDIEALGIRAGAAIVQLGAVAFTLDPGHLGETFHRHIKPHPALHLEHDTLQWHARQGTWPVPPSVSPVFLEHAMGDFRQWLADLGPVKTFWSWGSTYDFPLIQEACRLISRETPWEYWQCACARTIWRMAFPDRKHDPRPHHALGDAQAGARDLIEAWKNL